MDRRSSALNQGPGVRVFKFISMGALHLASSASTVSQLAVCPSASGSCSSSYTLAETPGFRMDLGTSQSFSLVLSWLSRPSRQQELVGGETRVSPA